MSVDRNEYPLYTNYGAYTEVPADYYTHFNIKRGLRNADGTGVLVGVTSISNVHGYLTDEGIKVPDKGRLTLRGYDIEDLVNHVLDEGRFGYEELAFLLWSGDLPTNDDLTKLGDLLDEYRELPDGFVANLIMNSPSSSAMNMLARSVLLLYAYDDNPDSLTAEHEVNVAVSLLSRLPRLAVLSYLARSQQTSHRMYINPPVKGYSTAQTVLSMLRPDMEFTPQEATVLDVMLMLHAEHGGGNNSTFSTRVLTSSGTDAYSAYAAGISSLKGPKHGGANLKAQAMQQDLKEHVADITDEGQVADYLRRVLRHEANDGSGLIYGMGHAVYTLSDPRAVLCKRCAKELVKGTEFEQDFQLIDTIERLTPELFREEKGKFKAICANIDMYSGLVYRVLGIPKELYTPLFAVSRMAGWAAHRFEEMTSGRRIMRPAYKSMNLTREYIAMDRRESVLQREVTRDIDFHDDIPND